MIHPIASRGRAPLGFALLMTICVSVASGCGGSTDATTAPPITGPSFKATPCSVTGTLQLAAAQAARVDCSNGGSTVTLAGNGASYLVVAQFAVDLVPDAFVPYRIIAGTAVSASLAAPPRGSASRLAASPGTLAAGVAPGDGPGAKQLAFTRALRSRARQNVAAGVWPSATARSRLTSAARATVLSNAAAVPALGSLRQFQVLANVNGTSFKTATAKLAFSGNSLLLYIDTLAPANGFAAGDLQSFGTLFDQTLYPIDTAAFGSPSDVDGNGRVVMLMSPAVNALTTTSDCQTQGYVAGFFDEEDLGGGPADPHSNNGEIFYSIVPDPTATVSCAHTVAGVGASVSATFLHELQHLISFSQHVVIHNAQPEYGWLDEGLSIVAEELGSQYYEQKCPPPQCRTSPAQLFPDSSQGFVSSFLYDSYQYALLPDTASVTLHSDSDDGFAWRGGDWLLMRWLGDQMGSGFYKKLNQSTLTGVANIQAAAGQPFPSLFANFGLALYTDSLPGLPRATAPAVNRFASRNVRALWNRLYVTSGGASDVPLPSPLQVFPITADTSTAVMDPGTMSYFRLDTPSNAATVSVQFAGPGGVPLPSAMRPQLAIFRLP